MIMVDKKEFKMWLKGTLVYFKKGKGVFVDELNCEKAMEALENGERIALTQSGKIISYAELKDITIQEIPI